MNSKQKIGKVLGELEKDVMEIIWLSKNPISVRSVAETLQKKRSIAYTTVMTIMGRLADKGILARKINGPSYLYQQKVSKEKFVARSVHSIFNTAIYTLGQEAVAHFAKEIQKVGSGKRKELLTALNKK